MDHHEYANKKAATIMHNISFRLQNNEEIKRYISTELELAFLAGAANELDKELQRMRGGK